MKDRMKLVCTMVLAVALLAGCGGEKAEQAPPASTPPAAQTQAAPPAGAAGQAVTLSGTVNLQGAAPARTPVKMAADPVCAKAHAEPVLSQDVVVDANSNLQHVFVYVKTGLEGQEFATPSDPVTLDQQGCQYFPHVFGIMVNQPLRILNSDPTLHNIHALPSKGEFNLGMPKQGMEFTKTFVEPEVPVHIKCDVHPWMSAWAGVMTHPFFAVTDEHGSFTIKDLPAGTYTLEAWHEKLGTQTQQLTVGAEAMQTVNFTFQATGS
jgi:hypothetical protein